MVIVQARKTKSVGPYVYVLKDVTRHDGIRLLLYGGVNLMQKLDLSQNGIAVLNAYGNTLADNIGRRKYGWSPGTEGPTETTVLLFKSFINLPASQLRDYIERHQHGYGKT